MLHSPISDQQWGFTARKSTTDALLSITHDCIRALDRGKEVSTVFFDISKAFDSVPHLHFSVNYLSLICCQWSQILSLASCLWRSTRFNTQPSVVPNLHQWCVVSNGKMVVYADDIALYQIIQSPEDYLLIQHDINAVSEWITANYLAFNYWKCCHLLFSRKRSPTLPVAPLEINGNIVNQANEFKYLGVILSSDMSWSSHISAISCKTRKLIGVLYRKFYLYYLELLQLANLPTLAARRKRLKLCLFYSMVNELATFPNLPLFLDSLVIILFDQ